MYQVGQTGEFMLEFKLLEISDIQITTMLIILSNNDYVDHII